MVVGHSILDQGPSGAGKSSLLRSALRHEGSGVVIMAPGDDEEASYAEFRGRSEYVIRGFDDPEFLPTLGVKEVGGFKAALNTVRSVYNKTKEELAAGNPLPYAVLGIDTISSLSQLSVNFWLKKMNLEGPPPALSPEGARFYGGIRSQMEEFMRPCRSLKGMGLHLIATSHVSEKEIKKTAVAGASGATGHMPLIMGSFRDRVAGIFDLVFHAGVQNNAEPKFYVQWVPDPKRPTKSRLGKLSDQVMLPNDWPTLKAAAEAALARRAEGSE